MPLRRGRVLVLDDEAAFARLVRRALLLGNGQLLDVDVAGSVERALTLQARQPYDVAIVDLRLPGGADGRAALGPLRAAGTRTIIYTGLPNEALDEVRREGCADRVISKDGKNGELNAAEELVAAVRDLLSSRVPTGHVDPPDPPDPDLLRGPDK